MFDCCGQILLISGPSGSGKSSLLNRLFADFDNIYFSISSTTRKPRAGEINGVNYNFISKEEFQNDIKDGNFLEWAMVHDNYYGTSLKPVSKALSENKVVVFDIDVQGFFLAQEKYKNLITSVFISTKNAQTLQERLKSRNSDDENSIKIRINNAFDEMQHILKYDYVIINDDFEQAYTYLKSIFISMQIKSDKINTKEFLTNWNFK